MKSVRQKTNTKEGRKIDERRDDSDQQPQFPSTEESEDNPGGSRSAV